ncbi:hypothetical protein H4219_004776 [Mycoemilia scoparia]|uniref:Amino acid permease/ SLC12A domain-containing protein n=1 Tax=Mycoemilia scoparia TaxID=417184 RepID=A0A9W7ZRG5_9FUNG|nr:hypothetical protein H4219_004776 [Mycoemilia scoparia]
MDKIESNAASGMGAQAAPVYLSSKCSEGTPTTDDWATTAGMEKQNIDSGSIVEEDDDPSNRKLQRKLKGRHLVMIAIGGTIGTGLFVGSGAVLGYAGPAGALVAYILMGSVVFFVCTSLGEVATYIPVSDPFNHFASRFIDPALGTAFGWTYWLSWTLTVASELVACGIVIQMWLPHVSTLVWSFISAGIIFGVNSFSVSCYGEIEYWFSIIKVLAVVVFIIVGILTDAGVLGGHKYAFTNWTIPGAPFNEHIVGILKSCITAAFSFQGTEIVGITVGEAGNPRKEVPKAIRSVFWRILFFYICSIFVIGLIIPYTDDDVVNASGASDIAKSPFTIVFEKAGLNWASHVMNAVVLITVLSAGNSGLYACTRVLWMLAKERKAPAFFKKVTKHGIPFWAMTFTMVWSTIFFALSFIGNQVVYLFLVNISGVTGFIFWMGISLSHLRFRRAYIHQGYDLKDLPYKAKWYPFGPYYALSLLFVIMIGQGYQTFAPKFKVVDFLSTYIAIPLFLIVWLGYKYFRKTKVVKLDDVDLVTNSLFEQERLGLIQIFEDDDSQGKLPFVKKWVNKIPFKRKNKQVNGEDGDIITTNTGLENPELSSIKLEK